jgi:hypothetical protein
VQDPADLIIADIPRIIIGVVSEFQARIIDLVVEDTITLPRSEALPIIEFDLMIIRAVILHLDNLNRIIEESVAMTELRFKLKKERLQGYNAANHLEIPENHTGVVQVIYIDHLRLMYNVLRREILVTPAFRGQHEVPQKVRTFKDHQEIRI